MRSFCVTYRQFTDTRFSPYLSQDPGCRLHLYSVGLSSGNTKQELKDLVDKEFLAKEGKGKSVRHLPKKQTIGQVIGNTEKSPE